jgi:phospholipid/cholesterol/gamma-HCH transport system permease protein
MTGPSATAAPEASPVIRRRNRLFALLAEVGRFTLAVARPPVVLCAMAVAVLRQGCRPRNWRRTLLAESVRQFHLAGIGSLSFILVSGLLIGLAMVFQFLYWLGLAGQSGLAGRFIVLVMIREVAPLLVALIIIGRCGAVNMVEFGHMLANGQLRMLEAQGVDAFLFLVLPRCLATALATFCLTVVFIATALITGYAGISLIRTTDATLFEFLNEVLAAMGAGEYAIIALKPLIMGLLVTLITCDTGLSAQGPTGQTAAVLPSGFVKSVLAVFLVSGALSLML